jgi:diphthine-ammonia ligase
MASPPLKVIALISGGKDSLFSILHCLANDHEVVALANLHPLSLPGGGQLSEDIDSFMYQTVGHAVIPLYAEALGIPLFREEITGSAVDTGREYSLGENGDDETEDLVPLLERVIEAVPGANAVCSGAILSTYQRTRVEAIATRLGLTPLSYLWQYMYLPPYRQTSLLDDMRAVGQDSRIIKVASGGLDSSFLWQNVADQHTVSRMRKRMQLYGGSEGGAVIGEGGEFETLALTGPEPLWKKSIQVGNVETVNGEGGSASARLCDVALAAIEPSEQRSLEKLRIPPLIDDEFEKVLRVFKTSIPPAPSPSPKVSADTPENCWATFIELTDHDSNVSSGTTYVQLANIMSAPYGSASDQMTDITHQILFKLHDLGRSSADITHTTILLRDMSSFTAINPIYGSLFTQPNPPSRVTVSCGDLLPKGIHMVVSLIVNMDTGKGSRQGLHVQSRSYWAPANIGPYSQATSIPLRHSHMEDSVSPRLVYVAGQIPLVPATMDMVTGNQVVFQNPATEESEERAEFVAQSVLSLQHLWRIGRAVDVSAWTGAVAFLSRGTAHEMRQRAVIACKTWQEIHKVLGPALDPGASNDDVEQPGEVDVWDIKNRVAQLDVEEGDCRPSLPDFTKISGNAQDTVEPPVFVAEVEELPRGAQIEWSSTGIGTRDQSIAYRDRTLSMGVRGYDCVIKASETYEASISYFAVDDMQALETFIGEMGQDQANGSVTIYSTKSVPAKFWSRFPSAMLVPCPSLWHGEKDGGVRSIEVMITTRKDKASRSSRKQ